MTRYGHRPFFIVVRGRGDDEGVDTAELLRGELSAMKRWFIGAMERCLDVCKVKDNEVSRAKAWRRRPATFGVT